MAAIGQPTAQFPDFLTIRRFSTADYFQMIESNMLGPGDHTELIEGMVVEMSPAGIPHNHFLIRLVELFAPLADRYQLSIQGTMPFAEGHVYDPDFLLLKRTADAYKTRYPEPADVLLLIEASQSSLTKDLQVKLPTYAKAGIKDYWIADLEREVILVHREPDGKRYREATSYHGDDVLSPLATTDFSFAVRQLFD